MTQSGHKKIRASLGALGFFVPLLDGLKHLSLRLLAIPLLERRAVFRFGAFEVRAFI